MEILCFVFVGLAMFMCVCFLAAHALQGLGFLVLDPPPTVQHVARNHLT